MNESQGIGYIGENAFADFCTREGLHWSKPEPDTTGKDFIVEWPHESDYTLDTRPLKYRCYCQVKTTTVDSKSVKVKLSALEWLVKDFLPTFVITPVLDRNKKFEHFVGFHISSELLSRSLKKLRKADYENKDPNKSWMTLSLSKGKVLRTDKDMRTYLESCIGPSLSDYIQHKEEQLRTLGYDDEGPEFQVTFTMEDPREFVECLMGERTLQAEFSEAQRTRFGIKAKDAFYSNLAGKGKLSVLAEYDQTLHLHTVNENHDRISSISLPAKRVALPDIPPKYWRAEANNGLIKLTISTSSCEITLLNNSLNTDSFELEDIIRSLSFWNDFLRGRKLEMVFEGSSVSQYLEINDDQGAEFNWLTNAIDLAEKAKLILDYCEVKNAKVRFQELFNRRLDILKAAQYIDAKSLCDLNFILHIPSAGLNSTFKELSENSTILVTLPAIIGNIVVCFGIAYTTHIEQQEDGIKLTPKSRFPIGGKALSTDNSREEYDIFAEDLYNKIMPTKILKTPFGTP
ncbi:MAG: hypothetical protein GYB49_03750 [Alphaproteobacteria bacterium]|nr:hypothetical protein [Alphaproteobacteria bacterium]|tara:strand:+ start:3274 stop:4821 length:1548 start_codon:yes stop_codon:yes gene_type:complete